MPDHTVNDASRNPILEQLPSSSPPLPIASSQCARKPKKRPTVTPRTFTRFFTPRSSLRKAKRIGASRQILRDITASATNRKAPATRRTLTKDTVKLLNNDDDESEEISKKRKRRLPISPETTPDRSSPLKRIRRESLASLDETDGVNTESETELYDRDSEMGRKMLWGEISSIEPILSKLDGRHGWALSRELGGIDRLRGAQYAYYGDDWQTQTSNFYAYPEDTHLCDNVADPREQAIPFCTTSCNTNSLIAIGDEEGGIRLLESIKSSKPEFSEPYLTFRPHVNAILDMAFSPDDLLLATASGDQTAQIIDMPTQRAIHTLAGHVASVKQTIFQPESSNVIATSSRDGSVQIWDLRCKGFNATVRNFKVSLDPSQAKAAPKTLSSCWARPVNTISDAHSTRQPSASTSAPVRPIVVGDAPSKTESPGRCGDVSITALAFLPPPRNHLLLTACEADATVKLWDLRTTHTNRRRARAVPLSTTRQPESHTRHRRFGLTSLALSTDGARLYTLCRDNTVYAYSTSHLVLGHAPELSLSRSGSRPRRAGGAEKAGLGPLYGFRHPKFHATTFYVKAALRPAAGNKTELLAVGSSDGCAVLFPTDERFLRRPIHHRPSDYHSHFSNLMSAPSLRRTDSSSTLAARLTDTIPIYNHGTALIRGHAREVTGLTWTQGGDLVSVGDDLTARCWRDGTGQEARALRVGGEGEGRRWGCGWAEVRGDWDEEDG